MRSIKEQISTVIAQLQKAGNLRGIYMLRNVELYLYANISLMQYSTVHRQC